MYNAYCRPIEGDFFLSFNCTVFFTGLSALKFFLSYFCFQIFLTSKFQLEVLITFHLNYVVLTAPSSWIQSDVSIKIFFSKCSFTPFKTCFALCSHSFDLKAPEGTVSGCINLDSLANNAGSDILLAFLSQLFLQLFYVLLYLRHDFLKHISLPCSVLKPKSTKKHLYAL